MSFAKGDRIGALIGTNDDKVVKWLGYGTYQGEHVPPEDVGGYNLGLPNPKLVLDNGDVVWGCEVWWGSEKGMKEKLEIYRAEGYDIQTVSIIEERANAQKAAEIVAE